MAKNRRPPASIKLEDISTETGKPTVQITADSLVEGRTRLMDALGTVSSAFAGMELTRLIEALTPRGGVPSEEQANAALAVVSAIAPRNELEAVLAVQIAATHALSIDALATSRQKPSTKEFDAFTNITTKLQRTLLAQLETLTRLRRGGRQSVSVRHVHVHSVAQAIVGNVSPGVLPGKERNVDQPRELTASPVPELTAVWGEEPGRGALQGAEDTGAVEVLATRRRARQRSAQR